MGTLLLESLVALGQASTYHHAALRHFGGLHLRELLGVAECVQTLGGEESMPTGLQKRQTYSLVSWEIQDWQPKVAMNGIWGM